MGNHQFAHHFIVLLGIGCVLLRRFAGDVSTELSYSSLDHSSLLYARWLTDFDSGGQVRFIGRTTSVCVFGFDGTSFTL